MCEYCNSNDLNRMKALDVFNDYSAMERNSIVPINDVFEHMLAIYNNEQMADCAVKRIERRNINFTPEGRIGFFAKDVVSELEYLLVCRGHTGHILDG